MTSLGKVLERETLNHNFLQNIKISLKRNRLTNVFVNRNDLEQLIAHYENFRRLIRQLTVKTKEPDLLIKYIALILLFEGKSNIRENPKGLPFFIKEEELEDLKTYERKALEFLKKTPDSVLRL